VISVGDDGSTTIVPNEPSPHPDCDPTVCSGRYHFLRGDTPPPEAVWGEPRLNSTTRAIVWHYVIPCPRWRPDAVKAQA